MECIEEIEETVEKRDKQGRFQKGVSGNPAGRPKEYAWVKEKAGKYTDEAIDTLVKWMRKGNPAISVRAAVELLNRAWGTPTSSRVLSHTIYRVDNVLAIEKGTDYPVLDMEDNDNGSHES